MTAQPFTIDVPQSVLDDLRDRLTATRWPNAIDGMSWKDGTDRSYMQELTAYWRDTYDWRAAEAKLNQFAQFKATIDGLDIHFIHERGKGPNPLPLLLTHGWPDSFFRFSKIIPLLTDPAAHGGDAEDSFDVIIPDIPGYGFSGKPTEPGMDAAHIADIFAQLMTDELGYPSFAAHGGDWGSTITEQLAKAHADKLVGIHLTDVPYKHIFSMAAEDLSQEEQDFVRKGQQWSMTEGAYAMIQATKPQTLALAMNDSPVGMAAWIVEKFQSWGDTGGDIESRFSKDDVLTNVTIYWVTQTFGSAARLYFESGFGQQQGEKEKRIEVPTGVAVFPKDLIPAPRTFAERVFNVQRWTEMPRGGHFAALEEPQLLADDLQTFFHVLR